MRARTLLVTLLILGLSACGNSAAFDQVEPTASPQTIAALSIDLERDEKFNEEIAANVAWSQASHDAEVKAFLEADAARKAAEAAAKQKAEAEAAAKAERERKAAARAAAAASSRSYDRRTGGNAPLACIRKYESESSGGYTATSGAPYWGAYQFDQTTWNGAVARAGYEEYVGVRPDRAPAHVQDAAAQQLFSERGLQPWSTKVRANCG